MSSRTQNILSLLAIAALLLLNSLPLGTGSAPTDSARYASAGQYAGR